MSDQRLESLLTGINRNDIRTNVAGAMRIANPTKLLGLKTVGADDAILWDTAGTAGAWANNRYTMTVNSGQFCIRQSQVKAPYFEGSPQVVETTFCSFQHQTGFTKRVGYFSSATTGSYDTAVDGFYLESDGSEYYLVCKRNNTTVFNVASANWLGKKELDSISWFSNLANFNVVQFEFLWLGGVSLKLWIPTKEKGWILGHEVSILGVAANYLFLNPAQPARYEIRSTGAQNGGEFIVNCAQVTSEGSLREFAKPVVVENAALIAANVVGTVYALIGIKARTDLRYQPVIFENMGVLNSGTGDRGRLYLLRNPTLSAPLSYANKADTAIQEAIATTQTVSSLGYIIDAVDSSDTGASDSLARNYYAWLNEKIDGTVAEYVLAYRVLTTNQNVSAWAHLKQF